MHIVLLRHLFVFVQASGWSVYKFECASLTDVSFNRIISTFTFSSPENFSSPAVCMPSSKREVYRQRNKRGLNSVVLGNCGG